MQAIKNECQQDLRGGVNQSSEKAEATTKVHQLNSRHQLGT